MNFSAASICADLDPRNNKRIQVVRNGANGLRTKVLPNQQIGAAQTPLVIPPRALRPRISKLECLEAKMANIEVSLSNGADMATNLQRHKGVCGGLQENPVLSKRVDSIANINVCVPPQGPSTSDGSINVKFLHHIATLQTKLDEKNSIIASLQEQLNRNNAKGNGAPNSPSQLLINRNRRPQRRVASPESGSCCGDTQGREGKMHRLQSQIDEKLAIIENLKIQLERMEVHDLDSRICQAELECMLEKEELNALTLQQELMVLKASSEQPNRTCCANKQQQHQPGEISLYSVILSSQCSTLMALDVAYDPQSPCFYATVHQSGRGLFILWAQDSTRMKKGDRLLEINGQVVWNFRKDDFLEFLHQEATSPLQIALLRNSPPLPLRRDNSKEVINNLKDEVSMLVSKLDSKIKENKELRIRLERSQKDCDKLKQDNMRLEHRNLYLEHVRTSPDIQRAAKPPCATGHKNASNLSLNTSSQSRKGNHENCLVKAKSVGHLDQVCQKSVNGSRWHVLNVEIPFSTVLSSGPRNTQQDSDSGHCSGDSVDDTVSQVTSPGAGNFAKGNASGCAQVPPIPKQRRHIPASVNAAKAMTAPNARIQRKETQQQSIIHLKVKGNTIALDDGGSDHEEWC